MYKGAVATSKYTNTVTCKFVACCTIVHVTALILKRKYFQNVYLHHFILFKKIAIVLESIRETIMPLFYANSNTEFTVCYKRKTHRK